MVVDLPTIGRGPEMYVVATSKRLLGGVNNKLCCTHPQSRLGRSRVESLRHRHQKRRLNSCFACTSSKDIKNVEACSTSHRPRPGDVSRVFVYCRQGQVGRAARGRSHKKIERSARDVGGSSLLERWLATLPSVLSCSGRSPAKIQ